jgi:hypothetical protein
MNKLLTVAAACCYLRAHATMYLAFLIIAFAYPEAVAPTMLGDFVLDVRNAAISFVTLIAHAAARCVSQQLGAHHFETLSKLVIGILASVPAMAIGILAVPAIASVLGTSVLGVAVRVLYKLHDSYVECTRAACSEVIAELKRTKRKLIEMTVLAREYCSRAAATKQHALLAAAVRLGAGEQMLKELLVAQDAPALPPASCARVHAASAEAQCAEQPQLELAAAGAQRAPRLNAKSGARTDAEQEGKEGPTVTPDAKSDAGADAEEDDDGVSTLVPPGGDSDAGTEGRPSLLEIDTPASKPKHGLPLRVLVTSGADESGAEAAGEPSHDSNAGDGEQLQMGKTVEPTIIETRFAHFEIPQAQTALGAGSFGRVIAVRGRDKATLAEITCAAKVIKLEEPLHWDLYGAECAALSVLKHANVVGLTDEHIDAEKGVGYLFLELCSGGDLGKALSRTKGRLSDKRVCEVLVQLVLALQHVHACGIVHKDINPENCCSPPGETSSSETLASAG